MDPVCFHIGSRPVYWFGILAAAGFGAALWHWTRLARREAKPPEYASDIVLWIMVGGILGARLSYVVANWAQYRNDLMAVIRIDQGGLIFYGGFIGGTLAVLLLAWKRRESPLALGDFVVSGIPIGHALGRIGCLLNGCCHGHATSSCLGGIANGRQPTQLYEALGLIAIYCLLYRAYRNSGFHGRIICLYLLTYPPLRFCMEFFRGDDRQVIAGMSVAQWISVLMFFCGAIAWKILSRKSIRDNHGLNPHTTG